MIVTFVGRRAAAFVLLCLGVTVIAFVLTHLERPSPALYVGYLGDLLRGDLGQSAFSRRPVGAEIGQYVPATIELALTSIVLACVLGVSLGALGALRPHRRVDQVLHVAALAGLSMPAYWLAVVGLYVFISRLGWLVGIGRLDEGIPSPPTLTGLFTLDALFSLRFGTFVNAVQHLLLPAAVLAAVNVGLFLRLTRTALLDVLGNDYVRAARTRGLPERLILVNHVLRAASPPVITVLGFAVGNVLAGSVLVENVFAWPGIGQYAFRSAASVDLPAIVGVMLVVAMMCILATTLVDVACGVLDPRLRLA